MGDGTQSGQYSASDVDQPTPQPAPQPPQQAARPLGTYSAADVDQSPEESDWWDKAKKIGQAIWDSTPVGDLSNRAGEIQQWAAQKLQEQMNPAKTPNPDARATFGLGVLRDMAGMVHGATTPTGAAVTAATIAAPEIMGPALVAHGAATALTTEGGALEPDALQQRLMGGAEAFGGAAAAGQGFTQPSLLSNALRRVVPGGNVSASSAASLPPAAPMQPALANTPDQILSYAAQKGIDLTPAEATGSPAAATVQALGERSLAGSDILRQAREATATKLGQNVIGIANTADPQGLGISEEQAGQAIQQSARNAQDAAHTSAQAAYQQLPPQFMQANVDLTQIRGQYFQKLKAAEVALANRSTAVAAQIQGALEQGANLGTPSLAQDGTMFKRPEMTVSDLLKVRSDAIQDGNSLARAGAPNEVEGIYRGLAGDVDALVEQQANQMRVTQQWRNANAGWRNYQAQFNTPSSPLYQIANQADPAKVTRTLINNGSAANVQAMQNAGMTDGLQALKRQVLTDIANRGFRVNANGLAGYSDSFLQQLFGPGQTKEIYLNGELARRMGFQLNPSGTSNVLLGLEQLSPEPSRWMIPVGAAKLSMPQPAANFLPSHPPAVRLSGGATLGSLAGTATNNQQQQ
jgi:hypothetical protein